MRGRRVSRVRGRRGRRGRRVRGRRVRGRRVRGRRVPSLQHGSMLFVPQLDPVLPLFLGQPVLFQHPEGENNKSWTSATVAALIPQHYRAIGS